MPWLAMTIPAQQSAHCACRHGRRAVMPKLSPPPFPVTEAAMAGRSLPAGQARQEGWRREGCGVRVRGKAAAQRETAAPVRARARRGRCGCEGFERHAGRACWFIAAIGGRPPQGPAHYGALPARPSPARCYRGLSSWAGPGAAGSGCAAGAQCTAIQAASRARPCTWPRSAQVTPRPGQHARGISSSGGGGQAGRPVAHLPGEQRQWGQSGAARGRCR